LQRLEYLLILPDVTSGLVHLIRGIADAIGVSITPVISAKMAVGGILADNKYDVKGATAICIFNTDGQCLLAVEVKTEKAYDGTDSWYRKYRAAHVLTPLYHFNAPTLLDEPSDWVNLLAIESIGIEFLNTLIICLSAKPAKPLPPAKSQVIPRMMTKLNKAPDTAEKQPKSLALNHLQKDILTRPSMRIVRLSNCLMIC
jgi:hypothetical protein